MPEPAPVTSATLSGLVTPGKLTWAAEYADYADTRTRGHADHDGLADYADDADYADRNGYERTRYRRRGIPRQPRDRRAARGRAGVANRGRRHGRVPDAGSACRRARRLDRRRRLHPLDP